MKALILLPAFLLVLCAHGQEAPLSYEVISEVAGTKAELYEKGRHWLHEQFNDSKEVITIQDKEAGELSGNGSFKFSSKTHWGSSGTKGFVTFKLSLFVKDGKYRLIVTNIKHEGNPYNPLDLSFGVITTSETCPYHLPKQKKKWEDKVWQEIKIAIEVKIVELKKSLKIAMDNQEGSKW